MLPAVRCFSCGSAKIGADFNKYKDNLRTGYSESEALDALQVTSDCCRAAFMTQVDASENISAAGRPETISFKTLLERSSDDGPRAGEIGTRVIRDVGKFKRPEKFTQITGETIEAEDMTVAEFTSYEGVILFKDDDDSGFESVEDFSKELVGKSFTLDEFLDEPSMSRRQASMPEIVISFNSTFWTGINWNMGENVQSSHKFYNQNMRVMKNDAINIFVYITPENYFTYTAQLPVTPEALIGQLNLFVVKELTVSAADTLNPWMKMIINYMKVQEEATTIVNIRRYLGLSMKFSNFKMSGDNIVTVFEDTFKINSSEKLAQEIIKGQEIKNFEGNRMIFEDDIEVTFTEGFLLLTDVDILDVKDQNILVRKKVIHGFYPRVPFPRFSNVLTFCISLDDDSILVSKGLVKTTAGSFKPRKP